MNSLALEEQGKRERDDEQHPYSSPDQDQEDEGAIVIDQASEVAVSFEEEEADEGAWQGWEVSPQMIKEAEACDRVAEAFRMFRQAGFNV